MAITQPSIYKIPAFSVYDIDPIPPAEPVEFFVGITSTEDISSLTSATLNIYDNLSDSPLISGGITEQDMLTFEPDLSDLDVGLYVFSFNIPVEFTLIDPPIQNGNAYYMTITVSNGGVTLTSNGVAFYCYTTPSITFNNIPTDYLAQKSFKLNFSYNQIEGELLNWYSCSLYKFSNIDYRNIWNAEATYITNNIVAYKLNNDIIFYKAIQTVPANILPTDTTYWSVYTPILSDFISIIESFKLYDSNYTYTFNGLENGSVYHISVQGETVNGTSIINTSSNFAISVLEYLNSPLIALENVCDEGYISITSEITDIQGETNPSSLEPSGGEIDLTTDGYQVLWENGLNINDNFTLRLWGRNFNSNSKILTLINKNNENEHMDLYYLYDGVNAKIALYAYGLDGYPYYLESNSVIISDITDNLFLGLQRIDCLYNMNFINIDEQGG